MGKLTPSKELRTVYKVLKRIHAAEQLEETDPGMFAPEVFDIDAAQRDRIMAMLQAEGLINGVAVRNYVGGNGKPVVFSRHMHITVDGTTYLDDNSKMKEVAGIMSGVFESSLSGFVSNTILLSMGIS